jgi:hypothetical protein
LKVHGEIEGRKMGEITGRWLKSGMDGNMSGEMSVIE